MATGPWIPRTDRTFRCYPQDELTKINKEIEDRHATEIRVLESKPQQHEAVTKEEVGAAPSPTTKLDELSLESDASKVRMHAASSHTMMACSESVR